ncbi:fibrinogen-like protein 1-like protein [Stegostoma tigrinum]|uniref:fibrinogen-like protein 1-like protein n=1 Tax=Stegostoma tigrinum TaxID=3053191 RepID=UPI0028709847|nr:fibrinogen-like protein 1-like protein [Stegostoma tigrinum]XP_048413453.2 fibrinogen-like protein 1-like protein [Stegostoma tigrinum]
MKMQQRTSFQIGFFLLAFMEIISAVPHDYTEILQKNRNATSGLYVIQPVRSPPLVVNCVMRHDGGWTVIQSNTRSSKITWKESWTTYKYGFGDVLSDHWLGNEYIYLLTMQTHYKLRIEFKDNRNAIKYAEYSFFYLEPESGKYTIRLGEFSGNVYDQMSRLTTNQMIVNQAFSTKDRDNDNYKSCCPSSRGGWWFDACGYAYLNNKSPYWAGISINKVTMMVQALC